MSDISNWTIKNEKSTLGIEPISFHYLRRLIMGHFNPLTTDEKPIAISRGLENGIIVVSVLALITAILVIRWLFLLIF